MGGPARHGGAARSTGGSIGESTSRSAGRLRPDASRRAHGGPVSGRVTASPGCNWAADSRASGEPLRHVDDRARPQCVLSGAASALDLGIQPASWLRFFAEAQDARVGGYNTAPAPATIYNPMDLRQGYVALKFEAGVSVSLRAGRQEMAFGGERLIGPADWGMSHTFDALDFTLSAGRGEGGFICRLGGADRSSTRFDRHKPGEHFYGAYGSIGSILPGMTTWSRTCCSSRRSRSRAKPACSATAWWPAPGMRVFGKAPGRLDYTARRGPSSGDRIPATG